MSETSDLIMSVAKCCREDFTRNFVQLELVIGYQFYENKSTSQKCLHIGARVSG